MFYITLFDSDLTMTPILDLDSYIAGIFLLIPILDYDSGFDS